MNTLTIAYDDELLVSMRRSPEEFADEARLLLAVKLYELGRVSSGHAARLAGLPRAKFLLEMGKFGVSPLGVDPEELERDRDCAAVSG